MQGLAIRDIKCIILNMFWGYTVLVYTSVEQAYILGSDGVRQLKLLRH